MKTLMIQGTGSSVGKSIIVTGLCRIFKDIGYKVVPFKSQNMALNSYITKDGKEMGRAQVVQAEACRLEPDAHMNPVLIKPNSDTGAQIILQGEVYGNMNAMEYHKFKLRAKEVVIDSFNKLSKKFDLMIIEGAGSPAEINLMDNDIANMGMAEIADAPVILVGDIDRGGVFASLYGTVKLLPDKYSKRIKAFLINKFRGDKKLLEPGLQQLSNIVGIPFIGVIPYIKDLYIQDEDGVAVDFKVKDELHLNEINIGVIKLPHISNFTDFDAMEKEPDVSLKYINPSEDFSKFDIIIIPGSKNTIDDLDFLKRNDFEKKIKEYIKNGKFLIGICGGFQMLGEKIYDPYHVESSIEKHEGLKLFKFTTIMAKRKTTRQVRVRIIEKIPYLNSIEKNLDKEILEGYEIHMGKNEYKEEKLIFENIEDGSLDGLINENGKVFGTYIHGIFDNDLFRRAFLNFVRESKKLNPLPIQASLNYKKLKEDGFNKLATIIKENIDMKMLMEIIGL